MKNTLKRLLLLIGGALTAHSIAAQEWKTRFPESEAAFTQLECNVSIRNNGGKLTATKTYSEDIQFATAKIARIMGRGSIQHSSFHHLKDWDAYTRTPDNHKYKVANVSTESNRASYVFYDDAKSTSFDFTRLDEGTSRHIEYTVDLTDAHLIAPYYMDRYFPVLNGKLSVEFPSSVHVKYQLRGINAGKIIFSESHKRDKTTYTFTLQNAKAAANYSDAPDDAWYDTQVIFYVDQFEVDGAWKPFLSNLDDLYAFNYGFIRDLETAASPELKQIVARLIEKAGSDREKARLIYEWVQANIKYVAFEDGLGGFVPRPAALVLTRRFGDCKDMSSILVTMLREAGVPAYLTWIGTRNLPYKYSEQPLPIVDNHMICTAKLGEQFVFLDGTDSDCIFGFPSDHIQGKEALLAISEKEYKLLNVETIPAEKNRYDDSSFLELGPQGITGKLKIHLSGYLSSEISGLLRYKNEKDRADYFRERFARGNNKITFANWKVTQSADRSESWISADLSLPEYARQVAGEWLLNLHLRHPYENQEIDLPKRQSPIGYRYLVLTNYFVQVKLPVGYTVSYQPQDKEFHNETWGFDLKYDRTPTALNMHLSFRDGQLLLEPRDFEKWNKVLEHLYPNYKQTAVFSKP
jgi:hypothetical protein